MQPNPVLIRIGGFAIYWYGLLIVGGAMLAAHIASKLSRRNGHDPELAWNLLLVVLITGIIGARVYHIISAWDYYRANPGQMFGLQMSGYGIFGAVFGGLLGVWLFARHYKLRFWEWADYCAPGLILAQAIGRWGNFFNQELYGPPTDLPWGIYIAPEHRLPALRAFERFHPTFFYESALNFLGFLLLYYVARRWKEKRLYGDIFILYGMIYAVIRFFIEFLRPDAWIVGGMPTAQWVSIAMLLGFGALWFVRRRQPKPALVYTPGEPWQPPEEDEDDTDSGELAIVPAIDEDTLIVLDAEDQGPKIG
jgi:phosphatidylglycerol---prolipoprotein diacylglyceryl transferase